MTNLTLTPADVLNLAAGGSITITGPTPPPPPPPPSNALKVMFAQNGATPLLPLDHSYNATITRDFPGGNGNAKSIQVVAGTWGGFQPSNDNGQVTDFSACNTITVDVFGPKGSQYSVQFLKGGDLPIVGTKGNHFTKLVDGWETFTWPALQLMSDNGVDVRKIIYKGAVESQNNVPSCTFRVDNWGGK